MKRKEKAPAIPRNDDNTKLPGSDELEEGKHYYYNEYGNWVFTALYHQLRGYCCKNDCRHCPYGFKKEVSREFKFLPDEEESNS